MSRIGRMPIPVPQGVTIAISEASFTAEGPKGRVEQALMPGFPVKHEAGVVTVSRTGESGGERAKHGLLRSLLANAVAGVSTGFERTLEIIGVGYKAEVREREIHFALGYSHPVVYKLPVGIDVDHDAKANKLTVRGADRQVVGQVSAEIRKLRRPNPYKAKGIKYADEILRRKVGKAGAK